MSGSVNTLCSASFNTICNKLGYDYSLQSEQSGLTSTLKEGSRKVVRFTASTICLAANLIETVALYAFALIASAADLLILSRFDKTKGIKEYTWSLLATSQNNLWEVASGAVGKSSWDKAQAKAAQQAGNHYNRAALKRMLSGWNRAIQEAKRTGEAQ